jgi:ubiquinone/menaquinone biosynthesis C-methylase UbiE
MACAGEVALTHAAQTRLMATKEKTITEGAFDNGARSGFNAWFFDRLDRYINYASRTHKRSAFAGLEGGTVVEIGAGAGANIRYLPAGTKLIAIEPNLRMHDRLRRRCKRAGIDLTIVAGGAEAIPLDDGSVDEVICSLVLCTVSDTDGVLAEIQRVLRPGGRFRFVEHVAAPHRGIRRAVQRAIRRPWGWVFEGCNPGKDTVGFLQAAGFDTLEVEHKKFRRSLFWPVNTAVWGIAAVR